MPALSHALGVVEGVAEISQGSTSTERKWEEKGDDRGGRAIGLIINKIIWIDKFVDKIETKHHVTTFEVEEVLCGKNKVRRIAKGDVQGEDVYLALGQTDAGRYLAVFFILKMNHDVLPISARDMDDKERRRYGRK